MMTPSIDGLGKTPLPAQASSQAAESAAQGLARAAEVRQGNGSVGLDTVAVSPEAAAQAPAPEPVDVPEGPSPADMAAERLGEAISALQQRFTSVRFRIDSDHGQVIVNVVSKESGDVVRQIPPDEVLKLRDRLEDIRGALIHETS